MSKLWTVFMSGLRHTTLGFVSEFCEDTDRDNLLRNMFFLYCCPGIRIELLLSFYKSTLAIFFSVEKDTLCKAFPSWSISWVFYI